MSNSSFRQAWEETLAEDPLQSPHARTTAHVRRKVHELRYLLTGVTFAMAGVYLALAVATVTEGEFNAWRLAGAAPALAAAFLSVHAIRRRSLPLCASALALLLAWPALTLA